MMAKSPAANLYDVSGNPVGIVLDGSFYRLQTTGKVQNAAGDHINPTSESLQSGSYPDPSSIDLGEDSPLLVDAWGNLQTRGPVFTDEQSFRDDYCGDSLVLPLSGTITMTNGSTTVSGSGSAFTSELRTGDYVRLTSHSDTVLAQIDYVVDDENLELVDPYEGATGTAAESWAKYRIIKDATASYSVGGSVLGLTAAVAAGSGIHIERGADYLPFAHTVHASISQRVANQEALPARE